MSNDGYTNPIVIEPMSWYTFVMKKGYPLWCEGHPQICLETRR